MNAILVSRFFLSTSKHICNLLSVLVLGKLSLLRDYSNAIAQQHLLWWRMRLVRAHFSIPTGLESCSGPFMVRQERACNSYGLTTSIYLWRLKWCRFSILQQESLSCRQLLVMLMLLGSCNVATALLHSLELLAACAFIIWFPLVLNRLLISCQVWTRIRRAIFPLTATTDLLLRESDTLDVNFVASRVKLDERISALYTNLFHARTEIFELEMRPGLGALVLLVFVVEVDSLVIV